MGVFRRPPPLDPKPANGCFRTPEEIAALKPQRDCGRTAEILAPLFAALFAGFVVFGLGVLAGALAF